MAAVGWTSPVVGLLGGMGPAATVSFLDLLVRLADAQTDQDHVDVIVTQHGSTPPRSDFILHPDSAVDPTPVLVADARRLYAAGADMLVGACNTACYFWPAIEAAVPIPCVSIVDVTAKRAVEIAGAAPVAIFATEGTIAAGLYQRAIAQVGGCAMIPPESVRSAVTELIENQVKAGRPIDLSILEKSLTETLNAGAAAVIFGCTELSVIYERFELNGRLQIVDSLRTLVLHVIAEVRS